MTIQRARAYTVIPFLVFSISEPLGGRLTGRLVRAGWRETRARKAVISLAFSDSVMFIARTGLPAYWWMVGERQPTASSA